MSRYNNGWSSLPSIPSELDQLQQTLERKNFNVVRLKNPDDSELREGIRDFINNYGYEPGNRLLFFFSGHGHSENDKGFLVPVNAPLPEQKREFRRRALSMNQFMTWARDIEAKHALFLFDSCFSGTVFKSKNMPTEAERYIRRATARPVRQFITAGSADEVVPAKSTFTPALVDALNGDGDMNNDGYITGSELGVHLSQYVPRFVRQTPQYGKISDYHLAQGDYVFIDDSDASMPVDRVPVQGGELSQAETLLWQSAQQGNTVADYQAYLKRYPEGFFGEMASARIENLQPDLPAPAPAPEPAPVVTVPTAQQEPQPSPVGRRKPRRLSIEPKMVDVSDGRFTMGSPSTERNRDSNEQKHEVPVSGFRISKYETTFTQYDVFARETGRELPDDSGYGRGDRPVINVSWYDATEYAEWLSNRTGKRYRLPTEAEWEYVARAGSSNAYSWGSKVGKDRANCDGCGSQWDDEQTAPVGQFAGNDWGVHDMHGNVWEWTCSLFEIDYNGAESRCESPSTAARALRGGSWFAAPDNMRTASRNENNPDYADDEIGFRLTLPMDALENNDQGQQTETVGGGNKPGFEPHMIFVNGGCYQMGSPESEEGRDDNDEQFWSCVDDILVAETETTVSQFEAFVEATNYRTDAERGEDGLSGCYSINDGAWEKGHSWRNPGFEQEGDEPVVCVSWYDATAYTKWLSERTGKGYRLPTEQEWEFAARAGVARANFWRENDSSRCRYANLDEWFEDCDDNALETAPVGSYEENHFGLYDVLGNVSEWACNISEIDCENEKRDGYAQPQMRGGSWSDGGTRLASRDFNVWEMRQNDHGFRVFQDIVDESAVEPKSRTNSLNLKKPLFDIDEFTRESIIVQCASNAAGWWDGTYWKRFDDIEHGIAIETCKAAVSVSADLQNADAKAMLARALVAAEQYREVGNYDEAMELAVSSAQSGSGGGMWYLGVIHEFGYGVNEDDVEATKWYRRSADQGYAAGQHNLAMQLSYGLGVEKDDVEALRWLRLAADQGFANAQYELGEMYQLGEGVPHNNEQAVRWFRLAADQGFAEAQEQLSRISNSYQRVIAESFGDWQASRSENSKDAFCLASPANPGNYLTSVYVRWNGLSELYLVDTLAFRHYGAEKLIERILNGSTLEHVESPEMEYTECQLWIDANNFAVNGRLDASDHWDPKPEFVVFSEDVMLFRLKKQKRYCVIRSEVNPSFLAKLVSALQRGTEVSSRYEPSTGLEYPKWDFRDSLKGSSDAISFARNSCS